MAEQHELSIALLKESNLAKWCVANMEGNQATAIECESALLIEPCHPLASAEAKLGYEVLKVPHPLCSPRPAHEAAEAPEAEARADSAEATEEGHGVWKVADKGAGERARASAVLQPRCRELLARFGLFA